MVEVRAPAVGLGAPVPSKMSALSWFWFDPRISKAEADFDVRHTLVLNGLWQAPTPHSLDGVGGTLLGGWQVGGIFKWNDGVPTTSTIGGDPMGVLNSNSDPFALPDRVPGCNPINSNYKRDNLNYINQNCYYLPPATPAIAAQCAPFGLDAGLLSRVPVRTLWGMVAATPSTGRALLT